MQTKKITVLGLCVALAMILSYIESILPVFVGIPGAKLGLPNMVIVLLLYLMGAEHTGYRTYYGGGRYGIRKVDVPVFTYTYQGVSFQSQLAQNVPYKKLTENMEHGNIHPIYINSKHPQTCIFLRKVRPDTILFLCMGLFIVLGAVMRMR